MNIVNDSACVRRLAPAQRGVFSKADLQTALGERHSKAFVRRLDAMVRHQVLRRFTRGWYVADPFDLPTLSQRIAPGSYVSFETVLARSLLIGPNPERRVTAVKVGRTREYRAHGYEIIHVGLTPQLHAFGHDATGGVRYADPEKAILDTLYFHMHGRRYVFDLYSDVRVDSLQSKRLAKYLTHYQNPKFVAFARAFLRERATP